MRTRTNEESISERLKKLEDIEAIKKLRYTYCYRVDKRDWDGVVELFAKECVGDYGPYGHFRGRKEVSRFFHKVVPQSFKFFIHMSNNPIIEVDGDRAAGTWYLTEPATTGRTAIWIQGRYNEEYVREGSEWKIRRTKLSFFYLTPYEKGWAKERVFSGLKSK